MKKEIRARIGVRTAGRIAGALGSEVAIATKGQKNSHIGIPAPPKRPRTANPQASRDARVPKEIASDIGLTRDEIRASAPILAAATRPTPPVEPLPISWRKYFASMARYAEAIKYRHRIATKHSLPIDWYNMPMKGGLSDVFEATFLDAGGVAAALNIELGVAKRLMSSGQIPSFHGRGLPLITTTYDLTLYLSMNRVIDWRVVAKTAGWHRVGESGWRDPRSGNIYSTAKMLAIIQLRRDKKFEEMN